MDNTATPKGMYRFSEDDQGFITWCMDSPGGFIWNSAGSLLHAATRDGKLCPHFRNSNLASGFEPKLTSGSQKICSTNRAALEAFARHERSDITFRECNHCMDRPV